MEPSLVRQAADSYEQVATSGGAGKLADLFAEDAVFHSPDGAITTGRAAIRAFYDGRLVAGERLAWHFGRVVEMGDECWAELENDDGRLIATDHFTVGDDGLITRMAVFLRPPPS
jgi:SnoaL-like domain